MLHYALVFSVIALVAAMHGGRSQVRSTPALGTCFSMWLPRNAIGGGGQPGR